jgi:hypothetical protein
MRDPRLVRDPRLLARFRFSVARAVTRGQLELKFRGYKYETASAVYLVDLWTAKQESESRNVRQKD